MEDKQSTLNPSSPSNSPIQNNEDVKAFIESFFSNLKCKVELDGQILEISNIPNDFEIIYGKKSPYKLTFNPELESEDTELVVRGSSLFKSITEYLERRGQTTSVKIKFDEDFLGAFKRYLNLKNADIHNLEKVENYSPIYKFTFNTNLQYLNEKEQLMNLIYIQEGKVIPFDSEQYEYESLNIKNDPEEAKKAYSLAKDNIRALINPRLQETSKILQEKMKREQARIKAHYSNQKKEYQSTITKTKMQIEQNSHNIPKLQKLQEQLCHLEATITPIIQKLDKEENFFLHDELHKHSLNINTKLVNTTIINCPIFLFNLLIKNKDNSSARQLQLKYNPLTKELSPKISCELCLNPSVSLYLCSSGHLSCINCLRKCGDCSKEICSKCLQKSCDNCAKRLCKKCMHNCPLCHSTICSFHSKPNQLTGISACIRCLQQCYSCSKFFPKKQFKSQDNTCIACSRLQGIKKSLND
ncbi:MAG: hypothetical protein AABX11_01185 [Nanoarchaeota archaeon]